MPTGEANLRPRRFPMLPTNGAPELSRCTRWEFPLLAIHIVPIGIYRNADGIVESSLTETRCARKRRARSW